MNTFASQTASGLIFLALAEDRSTAFVDPSAQIMGNVHIGPEVYVGPLTVIRADEPDPDGKVHPSSSKADPTFKTGDHSRKGGHRGENRIKYKPCPRRYHPRPFADWRWLLLALRVTVYNSTLEDGVWVGIGSIIMRATVPSHTMIPAVQWSARAAMCGITDSPM